MLFKLVTRMDRGRFRCCVVSMTDQGPVGRKIAAAGIPVFSLGMGPGRPTIGGLGKLYRLLRLEKVDVLQTWLYHADLLGLLVGRMAGVRRVVWGIRCSDMHLRNYRPLTALTVRLCGFLSSLVDAIVVNSEQGKDVHRRRGYHTDRMLLIPNGFEVDRFRPDASSRDWLLKELGIPPQSVLIGMVARYDPMKDHAGFLQAAARMAGMLPSVHFVLVGKGVQDDNPGITCMLDEESLKGRVHLLGLRQDIPRIMAGLDIAVSSSAFGEGFSNTIGEAMCCGVPCIVTDVGDSGRIVGETGIVVRPRDPEALAGAMLRLVMSGREARKSLGEKARERILRNFELTSVVNRFERLYEALVNFT